MQQMVRTVGTHGSMIVCPSWRFARNICMKLPAMHCLTGKNVVHGCKVVVQ